MKSLQESLFDSNIQITESLFDNDLVEKGVSIDFETLRDMLFNFGRRKARFFDRAGMIYHEGKQSIYIKKFLGVNDEVCFELEFGITKLYSNDDPDGVSFNIPIMRVHDRWGEAYIHNRPDAWKTSQTDIYDTRRKINSVIKLENGYKYTATIEATSVNIDKVFDLYDNIIEKFCSTEFEKELKKYIDQYSKKKAIPGLILDILMKKLIAK